MEQYFVSCSPITSNRRLLFLEIQQRHYYQDTHGHRHDHTLGLTDGHTTTLLRYKSIVMPFMLYQNKSSKYCIPVILPCVM